MGLMELMDAWPVSILINILLVVWIVTTWLRRIPRCKWLWVTPHLGDDDECSCCLGANHTGSCRCSCGSERILP